MTGIILFVGAGASRPFDVPTMKEMVNELGSSLKDSQHPGISIYEAIRDRVQRSRGPKIDLETVLDVVANVALGAGTMETFLESSPHVADRLDRLLEGSQQSLQGMIASLDDQVRADKEIAQNLISYLTERILVICGSANTALAAETYRMFLGELQRQQFVDGLGAPVSMDRVTTSANTVALAPLVATTNYDLCLESYFSRSNLPYVNGFKQVGAEHEFEFDPNLFDPRSSTPLLKLHGSIDWWKTKAGRIIETPHGRVGGALRNGDTIQEPCIRYPISEKQLFEYPFLELYSRFARFLAEAKIWIFVGYSFGDPSIRNLVRDLARPDKKLIVVHPEATNLLHNTLRVAGVMPTCAIPMKFPNSHVSDAIRAFCIRPISPPYMVAVS
jgi:hypothetical protein